MKEITLEKELTARIMLHKMTITSTALGLQFEKENSQGIKLPNLKQLAEEYAEGIVKQSMQNGTFEVLYEHAWQYLMPIVPDNLKVI